MKYINLFETHNLYSRIPYDSKLIFNNANSSLYLVNEDYKILAAIGIGKMDDIYYVGGVASYPGLGPLIYEFAMMYIYPNGLMPSRDGDIKGKAWNIWEKFHKRKDVIKKTLPFNDDKFTFGVYGDDYYMDTEEKKEYLKNLLEEFKRNPKLYSDPETTLKIFNSSYYMKPNKEYSKLLCDINSLPKHIIEYINEQDEDFFLNMYE
jgi:hypothetical protein